MEKSSKTSFKQKLKIVQSKKLLSRNDLIKTAIKGILFLPFKFQFIISQILHLRQLGEVSLASPTML